MNAVTTATDPSTALTLPERARRAIAITKSEDELKALAASTADIVAITNVEGRAQTHAARMVLKRQRIEIETKSEIAREDAKDFQKACIAEQRRLVALIDGEEQRLADLVLKWDNERERERKEKAEAERTRVAAIQTRLSAIRAWPGSAFNQPASLIAQKLRNALDFVPGEDFAEFREEAALAAKVSAQNLELMLTERQAFEAEQQRLAEERAELERQRVIQAEADRKEREAREAQRQADQEALRVEREKLAAEAEARRVADEARREEEAAESRKRQAVIDAENARVAAALEQQQAALAAEQQRLADEQRVARKTKEEEARAAQERQRLAEMQPPPAIDLVTVVAQQYGVPMGMALNWLEEADWGEVRWNWQQAENSNGKSK